ncbi:MAG: RidA family protein [Acidobacteria bacterium]|nr:RidA family protein [Acidobacteriota bacterium]
MTGATLYRVEGISASPGPLWDGAVAGDFLFTRELCGTRGGIEAQTREVLEALQRILQARSLSLQDTVKVQLYLTRMEDYAAVNAVYRSFMGDHLPPRSTVEVPKLPDPNGLIKAGCVAYRGSKELYRVEGISASPGPLWDGAVAGDFFFTRELCGTRGGIEAQTREVLEALQRILQARGLSLQEAVKVQLYLTRMEDYAAVNAVYRSFMGDHLPPRSTVEVPRLPDPRGLIKAGCIAYRGPKDLYRVEGISASPGPLWDGAVAGDFLFTRELCGTRGGIEAQTREVLEALQRILQARGLSLGDAVKVQLYLTRMEDYAAVNAVYRSFMGDHLPPRSTVEVPRLPDPNGLIKAGCIAYRPFPGKSGGDPSSHSTGPEPKGPERSTESRRPKSAGPCDE